MVVVKTGEGGSRKQAWPVEEENGGDEGETDKMRRKNGSEDESEKGRRKNGENVGEENEGEEELQPQRGSTYLDQFGQNHRMILI